MKAIRLLALVGLGILMLLAAPSPLSAFSLSNGLWQRTYGGSKQDYLISIAPTSDGGYIAAGSTPPYAAGYEDGWAIKLDANGNAVWQKTYGGRNDDDLVSIAPTSDGGYIAAGSTESFGAGRFDGWVIKMDANGNAVWQTTYGGRNGDRLDSIVPTSDGGYITAGSTDSFGAGGDDGWVIKMDADGNAMWQMTYGGSTQDYLFSVAPTSDGGYIAAGLTDSFKYEDGWVIKLDANGDEVWQRFYGGSNNYELRSIAPTSDGGYIAAGMRLAPGAWYDGWVIKLDANGDEVWQRTYGGIKDDDLISIAPTSDGGYITAGLTDSFAAADYAGWAIKLDADGNAVWQRTYGGSNDDYLASIAPTSDGGYITAGYTKSFGAGDLDGWVIKMDAKGNTGPNPPLVKRGSGGAPTAPRQRPGPGLPPFLRP